MKKLFLTSGIIACMACPAFATTGFTPSDLDTTTYTGTGGTSYTPASSGATTVTNGCVTGNIGVTSGSTTFTAQWEANPYHIIYKAGTTGGTHDFEQDGQGTTNPSYSVPVTFASDAGSALSIANAAAQGLDIYGYHFLEYNATTATAGGWSSNRTVHGAAADNTTATHYVPGATFGTYDVAGDTVLTAAWEADSYTVQYDCNSTAGGEGTAPAPHTATYDTGFTFRGNKDDQSCYKPGYHFDYWDCGSIVGNHATANDPTGDRAYGNHPGDTLTRWEYEGLTNNATITCSAVYAKNVVGLTWTDPEGGNDVSTGGSSCTYDENIVLPATPTRTGYTFTGWTASGTVDPNLDGDITTPAQGG